MGKVRSKPDLKKLKLLEDSPTNDSQFDWHGRVAKEIFTLVQEEEKGRCVSLVGTWGSGKSTVVRILEEIVAEQNKKLGNLRTEVFVFDVWLHINDPLRRSFIEELEAFLVQKRLFDKDDETVRDNIDYATGRRSEQFETNSATLEPSFAFFLVVYGALTAIGAGIARGMYQDGVTLEKLITTAICFASPLLLLLWPKFGSVLVSKPEHDSLKITIKTPEATAIEFQDAINSLLEAAQLQDKHKLIIVLDNLDRVSREEAMQVLATMRSLISSKTHPNVWACVPLDTDAMNQIFSDKRDNLTNPITPSDSKDKKELAKSFIEKLFDVSFYVAPPIVTHSEDFFLKQLQLAFGDILSPDEKKSVFNIYNANIAVEGKLAPRKIKRFINDLIALYRLWHEQIPNITTLSLYVLKSEYIALGLEKFLDRATFYNYVSPEQEAFLTEEDWQLHFAAIYYGVTPSDAQHLFFDVRIKEGLSSGVLSDELKTASQIRSFEHIFMKEINSTLLLSSAPEDSTKLAKIALLLSELEQSGCSVAKGHWPKLLKATKEIKQTSDYNDSISKGFLLIAEACLPEQKANVIDKLIHGLLLFKFPDEPNDLELEKLWNTTLIRFHGMLNKSEANDRIIMAGKLFGNSLRPNDALVLWSEATTANLETLKPFYAVLYRYAAIDNLDAAWIWNASSDKIIKQFQFIIDGGFSSGIEKVEAQLKGVIEARENNKSFDALKILGFLAKNNVGRCPAYALEVAEAGGIYTIFANANSAGNHEILAHVYAYAIANHLPFKQYKQRDSNEAQAYQQVTAFLSNPNDPSVVQRIAAVLPQYISFEDLIERFDPKGQFVAMTSIFAKAMLPLQLHDLSTAHLAKNYPKYSLLLSTDKPFFQDFVKKIHARADFKEIVFTQPFALSDVATLQSLVEPHTEAEPELVDYITKGLLSVTAIEWTEAFEAWYRKPNKTRHPIKVAQFAQKIGIVLKWGNEMTDGIVSSIQTFLPAEANQELKKFIQQAIHDLDTKAAQLYDQRFVDLLFAYELNKNPKHLIQLFLHYAYLRFPTELLKAKADDFFNKLLNPFIQTNHPSVIDVLSIYQEKFTPILHAASEDTISNFANAVYRYWETAKAGGGADTKKVQKVAAQYNVPIV